MLNLTRFDKDGLELFINMHTGESYASQSGLARMVGVSDSTILRWRTSAKLDVIIAEIPTVTGVKTSALYNEKLILKCVKQYNPDLIDMFAEAGIRVYLHRLAGFTFEAKFNYDPQPELPPYEEAVRITDSIRYITDNLSDNPRLAQFLIDHSISKIMEKRAIASATIPLRGVVEIAEEMGLPVTNKNRSRLGKFVRCQLPDLAQSEKRLVNGTTREVCCYPDTDEVREVIRKFFEV